MLSSTGNDQIYVAGTIARNCKDWTETPLDIVCGFRYQFISSIIRQLLEFHRNLRLDQVKHSLEDNLILATLKILAVKF